MTYAIQLTVNNGKKYFGYRNYKGAWTTCMTVPEATTFKTEKGAWRALQNGDKFVKLEYACSCWQDSLQREGYDVDVVNVDDQESAEVFVEAVEQSVVEPVSEVEIALQEASKQKPIKQPAVVVEPIYIRGTEISTEQAEKNADEGLNELFRNRHKLKQQFLIVDRLLAKNGMKLGHTLINSESVLRLVIYWGSEKAVLEWTSDEWPEGWKIIPFRETADSGQLELKEYCGQSYQTLAVDADIKLQGAWTGFDLYQHLKDSGVDMTNW